MDTNSPNDKGSSAARSPGSVLVADVGGTNARFATASAADGVVQQQKNFATDDFADAKALLAAALAGFDVQPQACAIAVAGPVAQGRGKLTNGTLEFSEAGLAQQLGAPVRLLNDFASVAAAIDDSLAVTAIGPHTAPGPGVRAVLGPGTGLGMAYLVPLNNTDWQVQASEGGNADFAPADELSQEVLAIARAGKRDTTGTVSIESLVSGRGLPLLYSALCELWGAAPVHEDAAQISAAALAGDPADTDVLAHKCLELFCALLGTAAGNFALTVGATGGVYLAGGILPRIREFFLASEFRAHFDERGALGHYNKQIATFLVDEPDPGLLGAVKQAQGLLKT